jgi:hypothetical protein
MLISTRDNPIRFSTRAASFANDLYRMKRKKDENLEIKDLSLLSQEFMSGAASACRDI